MYDYKFFNFTVEFLLLLNFEQYFRKCKYFYRVALNFLINPFTAFTTLSFAVLLFHI